MLLGFFLFGSLLLNGGKSQLEQVARVTHQGHTWVFMCVYCIDSVVNGPLVLN